MNRFQAFVSFQDFYIFVMIALLIVFGFLKAFETENERKSLEAWRKKQEGRKEEGELDLPKSAFVR